MGAYQSSVDDQPNVMSDNAEVSINEKEFKKIHDGALKLVENMNEIPCQEISKSIIQCLTINPNEIAECYNLMDSYRVCVFESTMSKILSKADPVEVNNAIEKN